MMCARQMSVVVVGALLLLGCAHIPSIVADVKVGMEREEAIRTIHSQGTPTFYYLKDGATEYVLFRNTPSFMAM